MSSLHWQTIKSSWGETSKQATSVEHWNLARTSSSWSFLYKYSMYENSGNLVSKRFNASYDNVRPPSFNRIWNRAWGNSVNILLCFRNCNNKLLSSFILWHLSNESLFVKRCRFRTRTISSEAAEEFTHSFAYTSSKSNTYFVTTSSRLHSLASSLNSNMCVTPCCNAYFAVSLKCALRTPFRFSSSSSSMQSWARMLWHSVLTTVKLWCP